MRTYQIRLLLIYLTGFVHVFLIAAGLSIVLLWLLQAGAMAFDETHDWDAVFGHLFLTISFVLFYPGQRFVTYRVTDRKGREYIIIGDEADEEAERR